MLKSLRLVGNYLRHNLMSAMAYRGAFLLQVFGMMLNNVMLLFFWAVLFQRFPDLNGWDLRDIVALYGIIAGGFGLASAVCGNAGQVARIIASGDLDYYLALPADPLVHLLVSRTALPAWGDILFGLAMFLVATPGRWRTLPLFILLGTLSGLIFVAFSVIVGSLAFWLGQAQNLAMQLRNALLTFGLYPIDIFPGLVRLLLYTLIPAAFVGSIPAELLSDFHWGRLTGVSAFTLGILALARWVFERGLRRYESGNLVTTRG
jgi:ABC-2 type transport system permease protein